MITSRVRLPFGILLLSMLIQLMVSSCDFWRGSKDHRLASSVVLLTSSHRLPNYSSPWQVGRVNSQKHLGVFVGSNEILTTAQVVVDSERVEAQFFGESEKRDLEVIAADVELNLALLKFEKGTAKTLPRTQELVLGPELDIGAEVSVAFAQTPSIIRTVKGELRKIEHLSSNVGRYHSASYQIGISGDLRLGWSEPVLFGDKLVGLSAWIRNGNLTTIPISQIKHFLEGVRSHSKRLSKGVPSFGIKTVELSSPLTRELLGVSTDDGVLVTYVSERSPFFDKIKVDDVLVSVDGRRVSHSGLVEHPRWDSVPYPYLLLGKYPGDKVRVQVIRQGKRLDFNAAAASFDSNKYYIPNRSVASVLGSGDRKIPHLVVGGALLMELSRSFLRNWGNNWSQEAPLPFLYKMNFDNRRSLNERVLVVASVLADSVNVGYEGISNKLVEEVNGEKVQNLTELKQALETTSVRGHFIRVRFPLGQGEIVFDRRALSAANTRIQKEYGIKSKESFFWP